MTDLKGFITRIEAQSKYDRSKTSFIRDVDQARARGDADFLNDFMVVMKDDTNMSGVEATKQALKNNDHLKPEWYIRESLLEKRYWLKGRKAKASRRQTSEKEKTEEPKGDSQPEKPNGSYVALLEQTNSDLRDQTKRQLELISELTDHQKQSNVLVKSLTDLLSGNTSEEAISALGMKAPTVVRHGAAKQSDPVEYVDVKQPTPDTTNVQNPGETLNAERGANKDQKKPIWKRDMFWLVNQYFDK